MIVAALSERSEKLLLGVAAGLLAVVASRLLRRLVARLEARHPEEERELVRLRRGETVIAIVATAVPYIAAIAILILVAGVFLPGTAAAVGGSALVVILVGFGVQRFLMDVIAGILITFERWYAVGDFVLVEPSKASGIVEQFGFRTTVIRSLNGDRIFVPNSQINAAARSPRGFRSYSIELLIADPEAARRALEDAGRRAPRGEARFLRPPHVVEERELGEALWLVRGRVDVAPTMEWLAENLLVNLLKAQLEGDSLLADPIVYTLDEPTLSRYERRLLLR